MNCSPINVVPIELPTKCEQISCGCDERECNPFDEKIIKQQKYDNMTIAGCMRG